MIIPKGERGKNGVYDISYGMETFKFPSVTTVLSSLHDKGLENLRSEIGEKCLNEISMRAANRGSVMHLYLENFAYALKAKGDRNKALLYSQKKTSDSVKNVYTIEECEKGLDFFYNIFHSEFIEEFKHPLLIEGLMVSFINKYAGRTDIIYKDFKNLIVLGDYKSSSSKVLPGSFKEKKYKLQLSAYINAFEEVYKMEIGYGVVWVAYPQGYQKIVLTKSEYPKYLSYFKSLINKVHLKQL